MADPAETYDHIADVYDHLYDDRNCLAENRIIQTLLHTLLPNKPVADIGCGTGLLLDLLWESDWVGMPAYIGLDPCDKMLEKFRAKHPHVEVHKAHYGEVPLPADITTVALFGVPNYIKPKLLDVSTLTSYFLMFYAQGYRPQYYQPSGPEPYLGYEFKDYELGNSYVTQFSNYMIVTDLL